MGGVPRSTFALFRVLAIRAVDLEWLTRTSCHRRRVPCMGLRVQRRRIGSCKLSTVATSINSILIFLVPLGSSNSMHYGARVEIHWYQSFYRVGLKGGGEMKVGGGGVGTHGSV